MARQPAKAIPSETGDEAEAIETPTPAPEASSSDVARGGPSFLVPGVLGAFALVAVIFAALGDHGFLDLAMIAGLLAAAMAWWLTRLDNREIRSKLQTANTRLDRQAAETERLADVAWELRESEQRHRDLIAAQGDLLVRRDPSGNVTSVNAAFADAFGIAPDEAVGAPLAAAPQLAFGLEPAARDVELRTPAGPRWYSWIDIPERDEDGATGFWTSLARDITARKANERDLTEARERAESANQAKSRLLATVSHEFRTPLNGILGLTDLLRESGLTNDQQTYAEGVQSSGRALLALVDDMLDFSRIEAGRLELHPEEVALEPFLQDLVELLAVRAHIKGIDIAALVEPGTPPVVVDPVRLRQVLTNLAGNGIKFTENGGVTVSARVSARTGTAATISFEVADTGPGVPPEEAERIFEEFEQSDNALNRRYGGAGLGLSISRRIVDAMGGSLTLAETRPGARFVFTLTLPVVETGSASDAAADRLEGRRALVLACGGVEPGAIGQMLMQAGAEARVVATRSQAGGLVAAAQAAGQGYHVLLIDNRPAGFAPGALAELREAARARLPAIVLVDPGQRDEIEALKEAGFDAYLVRPVRRASLLGTVGEVLSAEGGFFGDPRDAEIPPPEPRPAARPMDVLLAEDNEINALLARAVLEGLGHAVTAVPDGAAALAAVEGRDGPFGAILMDLRMPGLDGLEAIRRIRAMEAERGANRAPIVAVTADALPETRRTAEAAGATVVLRKPLTPENLREALAGIAG